MITVHDLQIQDNAVVSQSVLKQKGGNVTLFAFAKGQELSEHTAPFDALVHVIEGSMDITIDGTVHTLVAGQLLVMPANLPHALTATQPSRMILTMIRDLAP